MFFLLQMFSNSIGLGFSVCTVLILSDSGLSGSQKTVSPSSLFSSAIPSAQRNSTFLAFTFFIASCIFLSSLSIAITFLHVLAKLLVCMPIPHPISISVLHFSRFALYSATASIVAYLLSSLLCSIPLGISFVILLDCAAGFSSFRYPGSGIG